MPELTDQADMQRLIAETADLLGMPDPAGARHHARIALIDYAFAYRLAPVTETARLKNLIESAYIHMERAISLGWNRDRIDQQFSVIRLKYAARHA